MSKSVSAAPGNNMIATASRPIDSKLQVLCTILNSGQGGFIGMLEREFMGDTTPDVLTPKAIAANKGRTLNPQLQYLCNFLNSGKRLY
jgi:hypothetical protein